VSGICRPLLLLHGFTGTPRCFRKLLSLLPGVEALVPALRGHDGHEPGPPEPFEHEVARLAECVRAEVTERVHLVGYSLGARLGLGLLLRRPDLIASATLVGLQPGLTSRTDVALRTRRDDEWARLLERRGIEAFVAAWERQPLFASQAKLAPEVRHAQPTERRSHPGGARAHPPRARPPPPRRPGVGASESWHRADAELLGRASPRSGSCALDGRTA
jgi:2-succinyl-6-hydroxy-2,4-cyclohexadiene-1-carboxylate synthase